MGRFCLLGGDAGLVDLLKIAALTVQHFLPEWRIARQRILSAFCARTIPDSMRVLRREPLFAALLGAFVGWGDVHRPVEAELLRHNPIGLARHGTRKKLFRNFIACLGN